VARYLHQLIFTISQALQSFVSPEFRGTLFTPVKIHYQSSVTVFRQSWTSWHAIYTSQDSLSVKRYSLSSVLNLVARRYLNQLRFTVSQAWPLVSPELRGTLFTPVKIHYQSSVTVFRQSWTSWHAIYTSQDSLSVKRYSLSSVLNFVARYLHQLRFTISQALQSSVSSQPHETLFQDSPTFPLRSFLIRPPNAHFLAIPGVNSVHVLEWILTSGRSSDLALCHKPQARQGSPTNSTSCKRSVVPEFIKTH